MIYLLICIIFPILLAVSIIVNIIVNKRHIDLYNEESLKKIKEYKYKKLEIKRKRRASRWGSLNQLIPFNECPLETEYPESGSIFPPEDNIEVYGIEENKKYLIYKMYWSKDSIKKIINIVNELNKYFETK